MRDLITTTMLVERQADNTTEVTIEGYVHFHVETDYGADADNNRGEKRIFVDDVTDVQAYDQDGEEVELIEEDEQEAINLLTHKFLEN